VVDCSIARYRSPVIARARMLVLVAAFACSKDRPTPVAPSERPQIAPPTDPSPSVFDQALADMLDQCTPLAADGAPRVHERRIDLDRDGRDEAIFNVSCADVSQWKLLGEHNGEAVTLLERIATETDFDVLLGPDGRALLVIQHDCCCMYELEVHTLHEGEMKRLFAWNSGCGPGCESGYQADVQSDPGGNLRAITLPKGACGADGRDVVDLRAWTTSPAPP
jgi:hypothetical protein